MLLNWRSVFFLEVLLKFIDKVPEEKRDHKYAEEFQDLRSHVVKKLKEQDPNYVPPSHGKHFREGPVDLVRTLTSCYSVNASEEVGCICSFVNVKCQVNCNRNLSQLT